MTTQTQQQDAAAGLAQETTATMTLTDVIGEPATATAPEPETLRPPDYAELRRVGRTLNAGMTRSLLLEGNVDDLYFDPKAQEGKGAYVPLIDLMKSMWAAPGRIVITYQLNGPIRIEGKEQRTALLDAWIRHRTGKPLAFISGGGESANIVAKAKEDFNEAISKAAGQPAVALEMLRQLCLASRSAEHGGQPLLAEHLIVIVKGMDMLIPEMETSRISDAYLHRIAICEDWLTDPAFTAGGDAVIMIAESRGMVNSHVTTLPQLMTVTLPAPDEARRRHCIDWFNAHGAKPTDKKVAMPDGMDFAQWTAGLSIHALTQLMREARYGSGVITSDAVIGYVESYIKSQLGDDVVEFKKPTHRLDETVGNTRLKTYLREHLIPRFKARDKTALTGAAVGGPMGGGKTYVFEAVATELDMPVLVLKSIRSQWYGQTDVIIGRLRRLLGSLSKALIFVDEADAQFSDVSKEEHSTEKRATGQFLQMMSDPAFKGRILWLLMTARVHLLPPDMKRPGRVGDLIIPVLDPEGDDRKAFVRWALAPVMEDAAMDAVVKIPEDALPKVTTESIEAWAGRQIPAWKKQTRSKVIALMSLGLLAIAVYARSIAFGGAADASAWSLAIAMTASAFVIAAATVFHGAESRRKSLVKQAADKLAAIPKEKPLAELVSDWTAGYSAASFALLRSELVAAKKKHGALDTDAVFRTVRDIIPPTIEDTRRYQTLQALVNCTRRSLLPDLEGDLETVRRQWQAELASLERKGIR